MANNEKRRKLIKRIISILLSILIFLYTDAIVYVNAPVKLGMRKVDTIKIMKDSKDIFVRDQEKIDKFIGQMKYKFAIPSFQKEQDGYHVMVFYNGDKVAGVFAYNIEKRLIYISGKPFSDKPLSSDLCNAIESFIIENFR